MNLPRFILVFSILIFSGIGVTAWWKKNKHTPAEHSERLQITLQEVEPEPPPVKEIALQEEAVPPPPVIEKPLPTANRIREFFNKHAPQFPIVKTIVYKSRVDWKKGASAWLSDYASHYKTSKHFIARSLHNRPEYLKQNVSEGDRFNVLNDQDIRFHLLVDIGRCKLWFYYIDGETQERVLVKDYTVGVGRKDETRASGSLTPLGKYLLGNKIATYEPKKYGLYNGEKTEMVTIFGTRWIPFDEEIGECTDCAKGYGIHGVPLVYNESTGSYTEDTAGLGEHASDGCIRLNTNEMEELFAIIVSRPTTIEIVKDYFHTEQR